ARLEQHLLGVERYRRGGGHRLERNDERGLLSPSQVTLAGGVSLGKFLRLGGDLETRGGFEPRGCLRQRNTGVDHGKIVVVERFGVGVGGVEQAPLHVLFGGRRL